MRTRLGVLIASGALGACAGKPAAPAGPPALTSSSPPGDAAVAGILRAPPDAPTRDCPAGLLAALAPRFAADEADHPPRLDVCVRGRFLGQDAVVVYASAPPPPDSQSEAPWPAWRLITTVDGAVLVDGPPAGGDWMTGAPALDALVDLDGDGSHEIVELDAWDPVTTFARIYQVGAAGWVELARFVTAASAGEPTDCAASWTLGPAGAAGDRPMVVSSRGAIDHGDFPEEGAPACLSPGAHVLRLVDGELFDETEAELPDEDEDE